MNDAATGSTIKVRTAVPRGIAATGPAILSYGFRPFFLFAAAFAVVAMLAWIAALSTGVGVGGNYGVVAWHAHEMLFGYVGAALAGFVLTAVPNWTGRLPVSGLPLVGLLATWLAGRLAMAFPDLLGPVASVAIDALFLPVLAAVVGREIVAGRNWRNLKILGGLTALALANAGFHLGVLVADDITIASRLTIGVYSTLVALVGGRIIPSFTRNWLVKAGAPALPKPYSAFDTVAIVATPLAFLAWALMPEQPTAAALAALAGLLQAVRLWRWQGWRTWREPLLLVMHIFYAFLPLGLFLVGAAEAGLLPAASALHVLTVGAIAGMTLAVMTRASLGHTGHPLHASPVSTLAYLLLGIAALARPAADLVPAGYHLLLLIAGLSWLAAYSLFLAEYGPMLLTRRSAPASAAP